MAASNINRVILTGNLTFDPELRSPPSGMSVCKLRVAVNTRKKNNATGDWEDKPNYFDVTVPGAARRELRALPGQGAARSHRWSPAVERVGRQGHRQEPLQGRDRRRHGQFLNGREDGAGGGEGGFAARRRPGRHQRLRRPGRPAAACLAPVSTPADDDIPF